MKRSFAFLMILVLLVGFTACVAKDAEGFQGANSKWSITLTDKFGEGVVQKSESMLTTSFKTGDGLELKIIEVSNPGYVADEKRLEEETTAVDELEPTRSEVLTIEKFGKVYGAVVTDHTLSNDMFYYMTNVGDDVIYLLFIMKEGQLTEEREKQIKGIVTTLTLK